MVSVAVWPVERRLISDHAEASGFHVCVAACWGVSFGNWFDSATHRWSISPIVIRSPRVVRWIEGAPPENSILISQVAVEACESRQRKVGAAKSGGKMDSSPG